MSVPVEIILWGERLGAVILADGSNLAQFQYAPEFITKYPQRDVSPVHMPLSNDVYDFPEHASRGDAYTGFKGLPGLLADSLPDAFGNAILNDWLARQGRDETSITPLERLCYIGSRGMGALEYQPANMMDSGPLHDRDLAIDQLIQLAANVLEQRTSLNTSFSGQDDLKAIRDIVMVGTSAGGARAKAIITWNADTNQIRSGHASAGAGFNHWMIKFDGIDAAGQVTGPNMQGYGRIEHAYGLMATAAGIHMAPHRLHEEGGRAHFMTKRFDRTDDGGKLHMQSLHAIGHLNYLHSGAHSYERAITLTNTLCGAGAAAELFRRMVFNVLARNQDDHTKNISYIMDPAGRWSLSPAYDITYALGSQWTKNHQLSINNKVNGITYDDFISVAKQTFISNPKKIIDQVARAVLQWPEIAMQADIATDRWNRLWSTFHLDLIQSE